MSSSPLSVYLAGELFDAKHLVGNACLAEAIERLSQGRYALVLPQDLELPSLEAKAIRDEDFRALLACDAAVFQFDGPDLDSGTVAEFMVAKFADIPSVLLRTDFRRGGDRNEQPWNLMCSFYPRTASVVREIMGGYARGLAAGQSRRDSLTAALDEIAGELVEKLDAVLALPKALDESPATLRAWIEGAIGMG